MPARKMPQDARSTAPTGKRLAGNRLAGEQMAEAWALLLAAQALCRDHPAPPSPFALELAAPDSVSPVDPAHNHATLIYDTNGNWSANPDTAGLALRTLVRLYGPLLRFQPAAPYVIGHLGQSIDSRIATDTGDAFFVTGKANLRHLHRLRALCDAIVVGAGTVAADDPQLTTRLVPGTHPVRVILDPQCRLSGEQRLFHDTVAPVLRVCADSALADRQPPGPVLAVADHDGQLHLPALLDALAGNGLHSLFVEGGGRTVSAWMQAGVLDRLQLAVAPVLVGQGRPAIQLPPAPSMRAALRPPAQMFRMGRDVLWDFDLRDARPDPAPEAVAAGHDTDPELQYLW